jgi:hypothetical protein
MEPKKDQPKPKRDLSKVKYFNCGEKGHIATKCPNAETAEEEAPGNKSFVTWEDEATSYVMYQVLNTARPQQRFKLYDILLDNQSGCQCSTFRSIMRNTFGRCTNYHEWDQMQAAEN